MTDICIDQKNRFYTVQALDDLILIKLTGQLHLMYDGYKSINSPFYMWQLQRADLGSRAVITLHATF